MLAEKQKHFSGGKAYPSVSELELIKIINSVFGIKEIRKIQNNILFGNLIFVYLDKFLGKCLITQKINGGFENDSKYTSYDISLFDLTHYRDKELMNYLSNEFDLRNFDRSDHIMNLISNSLGYININLSLLTDLNEEDYKWSASLLVVPKDIKTDLFEMLQEYINEQLDECLSL